MKCKAVKIFFLFFACMVLLFFYGNKALSQKIQYSNENVFIDNPDHLQMVANIAGNHHLLSFSKNENPELYIFNAGLEFRGKIKMPFKFPEKSQIRIIPFDNYYYLYIHPWLSNKHLFWKIDGDGNFTDFSSSFQQLLASQSHNIKLGFQLIASQEHLWMVYHTDLENIEKSTVIMVQTDSLLNVIFTHKVLYDFNRDEEKLQQEILVFGRYLLVLKTLRSGTSLELMKVNLATGYTITNTFSSSGYIYSQSAISFNIADSTVTVSSLLSQPGASYNPKQFVFLSRMNRILSEQVPFAILKSQFIKNISTNFLLIEGHTSWINLRIAREQAYNKEYENNNTLYQDLTRPDSNAQNIYDNNRLLRRTNLTGSNLSSGSQRQGIRFSLLDSDFMIAADSLMSNAKDSYTIKPDKFIRFAFNKKEYLMLEQQFVKKSRGLLLVNTNDTHQLLFTDLKVMDRNDYLLPKAQVIPQKGIIIPFTRKLEAGLVKITME